MRRKLRRTNVRAFLILLAVSPFLIWSLSSSAGSSSRPGRAREAGPNTQADSLGPKALAAAMLFAPPKANLDQVRNGSFDAPLADPDWVNGNAGASNAHYFEGQSIPYRLRLDNLVDGSHIVFIEWDTRHSGVNAIDYITYYDRLPDSNPNPLKGLTAANYGSPTLVDIPRPGLSNGATIATNSFDSLSGTNDKKFTVYNASNVVLTYENEAPLTGAQTATSLKITFQTSGSKPVLFVWGGHIASRGDWGFTNGVPNSAGGISGSPYHTRLLSLDGSGGNQDRSLSAAAVKAPEGCTGMTGPTTACRDTTAFYEKLTGLDASATYKWEIVNSTQTTVATFNGTPDGDPTANGGNGISASVNTGSPGFYTVRATPMNAGGSAAACEVTTEVKDDTAATDLVDVPDACPGDMVSFSTTASGGDGTYTYSWTLDGNPLPDTDADVTIDTDGFTPGPHTVEVTVDDGFCGSAVQSSTFNVKTNTSIFDPIDEASACDVFAGEQAKVFQVGAAGDGPFTYAWTVDNNPVTDTDGDNTKLTLDGSSNPKLIDFTSGEHTVKVSVTGACNTVESTAKLTINSNPTVQIAISQECGDTKLTANPSPTPGTPDNYTYSWSGPGIVGATNTRTISVNATGVYSVTVTDPNSCTGSKDGQLCFSLTTPAPTPTPTASIQVEVPAPNSTAGGGQQSHWFTARVAKLLSWLI